MPEIREKLERAQGAEVGASIRRKHSRCSCATKPPAGRRSCRRMASNSNERFHERHRYPPAGTVARFAAAARHVRRHPGARAGGNVRACRVRFCHRRQRARPRGYRVDRAHAAGRARRRNRSSGAHARSGYFANSRYRRVGDPGAAGEYGGAGAPHRRRSEASACGLLRSGHFHSRGRATVFRRRASRQGVQRRHVGHRHGGNAHGDREHRRDRRRARRRRGVLRTQRSVVLAGLSGADATSRGRRRDR